ncbi:MAG TPA: site-2 protease family protein, partial [Dongiaceae bacterium]|nr:site-2 protease family protein [Dongiaceae bacterium]
CVLLHELGHALAARRYGIRTRDITLLPIGGLARLERMPEKPSQELVVALAGPAVNVVIALALGVAARGMARPFVDMLMRGSLLESLLAVNVWMVLFNLIPAFPMDGGRVLRALLAVRMSYARATRIASGVGQVVAVLFGVAGVFSQNVLLLFIALFVFLAAGEERTVVETRASIEGLPVRDAMLTEFHGLEVDDPLRVAVQHLMAGNQTDFPVLERGHPVGVLSSVELITALSRAGPQASVGTVVHRSETSCDADDPLDDVLARVRGSGRAAIPVTKHGALVGLLTLDNVGELLLVRNAIRQFHGDAKT